MKILLLIIFLAFAISNGNGQDLETIRAAVSGISAALSWAKALQGNYSGVGNIGPAIALNDCVKFYEASQERLERLVNKSDSFSNGDAVAWLSGAMVANKACLDGLAETGTLVDTSFLATKLKDLLENALAALATIGGDSGGAGSSPNPAGLLASWSAASSNADVVVAQDGSGQYTKIIDALAAVAAKGPNRPQRMTIYVKSGTYNEHVNVGPSLKNLFFVGDGIGKTIVTGNRVGSDLGSATRESATFGVYADGFWARDITFQNTAGPKQGQAVALCVQSDESVFYRCSMDGYQDTLLAWQYRQFYRDCKIYGTIDFVFGDAAAVFQNCDFIVRRPLITGQYNVITAQGRDSGSSKTGFVILESHIIPDADLAPYKSQVKSYLGRPWFHCPRVLFAKTAVDDLVDPAGWDGLSGGDISCGMFFGEYKNMGSGADTSRRAKSPGVHVVNDPSQISGYSVRNFIQGDAWLPATGVPFSADIQ